MLLFTRVACGGLANKVVDVVLLECAAIRTDGAFPLIRNGIIVANIINFGTDLICGESVGFRLFVVFVH